jgi:tetratricopeptide (TPR) repeat protein/tRNA A-37 threonylcarbamoyl transferase component Bud32
MPLALGCPDETELVEYVEGLLPEEGTKALDQHVDACTSCRRVLASFALGSRPPEEPAGDALPAAGERYEIHDVVGTGAMSVVYAATDRVLDRKVAFKVLRDPDPDQAVRLQREAQAMAKLAHPNVVPVHDVGIANGRMFLTAELVAGRTLAAWLDEVPRGWRAIVNVFVQAGRGLAAAHAAGIAHRDFKPSNVLVGDDGRVRVADFGLARRDPHPGPPLAQGAQGSTGLVGTPAYMAPEQLAGGAADANSDQFAFCVALFEALYGVRPFNADDLHGLRAAIARGPVVPRPPRHVPRTLRAIVLRGLASDPHKRHASIDRLGAALERCLGGTRRTVVAASVVAALALIATGVAIAARSSGAEPACNAPSWRGTWDPPRAMQVAVAFVATRSPAASDALRAVIADLDRATAAWSRTYVGACEATDVRHELTARTLDLTLACLDERRSQLRSLTDIFAAADRDVVARASLALAQLGDPAECGDPKRTLEEPDLPADPATRASVARLRADIARARALQAAGKYTEAIALLEERAPAAKAASYRLLDAELAVTLGTLHAKAQHTRRAEAILLDAIAAAQAAGDVAATATAATELAHIIGEQQQRFDEARRWTELAAGAVERLGGDRALAANLAMTRGAIAVVAGDTGEAIAQERRATELVRELAGEHDARYGIAIHGLGLAELRTGDAASALRELDRAMAILEPALGASHPRVADVLTDRGTALRELGRFDDAERGLRRALAIREAALGADNPLVAASLLDVSATLRDEQRFADSLAPAQRARRIYEAAGTDADVALALTAEGLSQTGLGKLEAARAVLDRAVTLQERALGSDHLDLSTTLGARASAKEAAGDHAGARDDEQRAIAIIERASGRDAASLVLPLEWLAQIYTNLGDHAHALAAAERARAIAEREPDNDEAFASTAFVLARVVGAGDRARALARSARERFVRLGATDDVSEIDRWLASH